MQLLILNFETLSTQEYKIIQFIKKIVNLTNIYFVNIPSNVINLNYIDFSLGDVIEGLGNLKTKTIVGPDGIPPIIIST